MEEQKEKIQEFEENNATESKIKIKKFQNYLLIGGITGLVTVPALTIILSLIINGTLKYALEGWGLIYICTFAPFIGITLGVIGGGVGGLISEKNSGAVIGAIIISVLFNLCLWLRS